MHIEICLLQFFFITILIIVFGLLAIALVGLLLYGAFHSSYDDRDTKSFISGDGRELTYLGRFWGEDTYIERFTGQVTTISRNGDDYYRNDTGEEIKEKE